MIDKTNLIIPETADIKVDGDLVTISFTTKKKEAELPSYEDWYRWHGTTKLQEQGFDINETLLEFILTRKELLRRYIDHLADIVGRGDYIIYFSGGLRLMEITVICDFIGFKSKEAAQRIIGHAEKELKELYGVES